MSAQETTDPTAAGSVISLPQGGGAVGGLGETFSPDLFTGTGNFSVPIGVPPGRNGLQPKLSLEYSTGTGNGPFGLGWQLDLLGVERKTARGVPRYLDQPGSPGERADVFVLSGAEDLVPVAGSYPGRVRYRPRTEGSFARIDHVKDGTDDFWEVTARDGLRTTYGTPRPENAPADWRDPAVMADPTAPARVFGWRITETTDPLGNLVRYSYLRDAGQEPGHRWDQPLIARISYADYGTAAEPSFLVTVDFDYSPRLDPSSQYRAGFEIRTALRCDTIRVTTHAADGVARVAREYRLSYEQAGFNGVSLLASVTAIGVDESLDPGREALPPVRFDYSGFDPARRRFEAVTGPGLPTSALSDPTLALVDLRGVGLPDLVELGTARRFWRNTGGGRFALARSLTQTPPFSLGDAGVRLLDADGDGRADFVVSSAPGSAASGYFPMTFGSGWSRRSFQRYRQVPAVNLSDNRVKLLDLDGDGLTDVLRSGTRLEAWFNDADPDLAWQRTAVGTGTVPPVDLSDPRVRLADMTGDGLSDLVLLRNGNVTYWPSLGHGRWGPMITMRQAPRLPDGYDPRRVLLGDVDGDGAADLIYVDNGRVLLWGNLSGNGWTPQPITVSGSPTIVDTDSIQLADLHGSGMAGLLCARDSGAAGRPYLRFLDFTGGLKPYLLTGMDNNLGARTSVQYRPSTQEFLRDEVSPATRWRTTLPFPVQVVTKVEVTDQISGGRLTTEFRYHHGYWDGVEREFRGFAMVENLDTETFDVVPGGSAVAPEHYSPPTLTKSWFHPGPVAADQAGDWTELDLRHEYWPDDPPMLSRPAAVTGLLAGLNRTDRRAALRTLRGQVLRTELYALDGTGRASRPYTVTETLSGLREESPPVTGEPGRARVFFPFGIGERTTQWERGPEPMTRIGLSAGYDRYGLEIAHLDVAVPRGRDPRLPDDSAGQPYLATYQVSEFARRDDPDRYLVDRVARTSSYELVNDGTLSVPELFAAVLTGVPIGATSADNGLALRVIGHTRTYYDGPEFDGLALGVLGDHGLPVRVESLAFADEFLSTLFDAADPSPAYLDPGGTTWPDQYPAQFRAGLPDLAGYRHYAETDIPGSPGGFYVLTARHRYDLHVTGLVPRGLRVGTLDPFGALTQTSYDQHDLLPVQSLDPAGLATTAGYDYRVLRPRETTDPNGNTSSVQFSPLGLVTAQFVRGRNGEGDQTEPGTRLSYDLLAFGQRNQPASVRTVRRVHHDTDTAVPTAELDDVIVTVQYTDGFGRVLQTRAQAEDTLFGDPTFGGGVIPAGDLAPTGDSTGRTRSPADPDNVAVSGWQVYDNKGRVVRSYEPFFGTGFDYAAPGDAELGQQTTSFYDPRGQVIRTVHADGSQQRVVVGIPADLTTPDSYLPTPWEFFSYDTNDNAGRTHPNTTGGYREHWNTPASVQLDALGRTVVVVARNGPASADWFTTVSSYDIQGNPLSITDPLGRTAFSYRYDLAKRRWRTNSLDAGRCDTVLDARGDTIETRDSKGALVLQSFDLLGRASRVWARDDARGPVTHRQIVEYGDGGTPDQSADDRAAARALNLLGRPVQHRHEAGLLRVAAVDFKGNVLAASRRMIADAPILDSYSAAAGNGWQVAPFRVDWTPGKGQTQDARDVLLLETTGYPTSTSYDALNRIVVHRFPTDVEGRRRELRPSYNRGGTLEAVQLDDTSYVQRIAYNARGQRALIAYGNGVMTRYAYDPHRFRLVRMRSERYTLGGPTYHPTGIAVQDHGYDYDLTGNILAIRDRASGSGIPNNPDALGTADPALRALLGSGDALDRRFGYDPMYRLRTATGREHQAPPAGDPWTDLPRGADVTKAQAYQESYGYDAVGGLLTLAHAAPGGFTRSFTTAAGSNRLQRMTIGSTPYDYTVDACGNLLSETTSRHYSWNHADRLAAFGSQVAGAEPSLHTQYLYDPSGARAKKLVRRQGGAVEVTHYLDGVFEHHRWSGVGAGVDENNQIHVLDDDQRVALVRVGPAHPDDRGPAIAFHLPDHLASSTAVLDQTGTLTNREEYTPYGETSFGSYTRKRYRFTGQERDEESGLTYHDARYCCPWLARWISADPLGAAGGLNLFAYAAGNPVCRVDRDGRQSAPWEGAAHAEWDTIGEVLFGGHWHTHDDGHTNIEQPQGGPGGMVGGAVSALTFRLAPTEDNPNQNSCIGMDAGAALVPTPQDAIMRLATGNTVSGAPASRASAAIDVALWVVPPLAEEAFAACAVGELTPELNELNELRTVTNGMKPSGPATLGGGSTPTPTARGTATVNWEGGHASIEVKVDGEVVHTHRLGAPGTNNEPAYFTEEVSTKARQFEVEVPDGQASQSYQHSTIGEDQGPYDLATDSCLSYCADVLNAGGCNAPRASRDFARWLFKNGVPK
jgi:RHS repeat-associated protein